MLSVPPLRWSIYRKSLKWFPVDAFSAFAPPSSITASGRSAPSATIAPSSGRGPIRMDPSRRGDPERRERAPAAAAQSGGAMDPERFGDSARARATAPGGGGDREQRLDDRGWFWATPSTARTLAIVVVGPVKLESVHAGAMRPS